MSDVSSMIGVIKRVYDFDNPVVFSAMRKIPRHLFVPREVRLMAYDDRPLGIGNNQTISQPYTVAFMTHLLTRGMVTLKQKKVLEIGTGSGYQAAILSELFGEVYSVEIIGKLAKNAKKRLKNLGYSNVHVKRGRGELGWPDKAPFDAIVITANIKDKVPDELFKQLKKGGVLVSPVSNIMTRYIKTKSGYLKKYKYSEFSFVPFVEEK